MVHPWLPFTQGIIYSLFFNLQQRPFEIHQSTFFEFTFTTHMISKGSKSGSHLSCWYELLNKRFAAFFINNQPLISNIPKIFGAFCSTNWGERNQMDDKGMRIKYFGTGECFLFRWTLCTKHWQQSSAGSQNLEWNTFRGYNRTLTTRRRRRRTWEPRSSSCQGTPPWSLLAAGKKLRD